MAENVSVVYNPLNPVVKKSYGLGVSNPYADAGYDFSAVTKGPEVKQEEGLFSRLGSMFGGGSNTGSNNDGTGVLDSIGGWFAPQGQSGASTAGNVLSGLGTAVGIGSGLAGMYYSKKQADLNKERAKMEKDAYNRGVQREAQAEARMQQFAKNAGNGAFYA